VIHIDLNVLHSTSYKDTNMHLKLV